MPDKQRIRIPFPLGGRSDLLAYQSQQPQTTLAARNVWPYASGRYRGGSRPGQSIVYSTNVGGPVNAIGTLNYIPDASSYIRSALIVIGTNGLYTDNGTGTTLTLVSNPSGLLTTYPLTMTERNQLLYIAVHSIVQATSSTHPPMVYDPIGGTVSSLVAVNGGTVPSGCPLICTWRDRIVLAGGTTEPYGVFMSRQSDPEDWDYSLNDEGAAVDLGLSRAGLIGEPVTSLTPHADNCLFIGCPSSLWMLQGDPRSGGQAANVSQNIGVVDRNAWCTTPDGLFVFLSADGLYAIPAGCSTGNNPQSLSREKLPEQLLNLDPRAISAGKAVSLAYDVRWRGIHIFLTDRGLASTDNGSLHWFFDWQSKSFWEVQFAKSALDPYCSHARRNYVSSESVVMFGGLDGYVRKYLSTSSTDPLTSSTSRPITSYVAFGPYGDDPDLVHDVRLDELDITLSAASGDVKFSVFKGSSAEAAATALSSNQETTIGHSSGGRNVRFFPRVRGTAVLLRLWSTAAWAFESLSGLFARIGRTRV